MLQIPSAFEPLLRELVAIRIAEARAQCALLSRIHGPDHADVVKARQLLDQARGLAAAINEEALA